MRKPCFALVLAVLMLQQLAHAQEYIPDANTVALWHFNETSGNTVYDSSTNGYDGNAAGTTFVGGRFGTARRFNGTSDFCDFGNPLSFDSAFTNQITIEGWLRTDSSQQGPAMIVTKSGGEQALATFEVRLHKVALPDYRLNFVLVHSNGTGESLIYADGPLQENIWVHFACTYDGSTMKMYINGIKQADEASTAITAFHHTSSRLMIGWRDQEQIPGLRHFTGLIDEVRISNKAREPSEFDYPVVKSVTPAQNALNVSKSTSISATFNLPMVPGSVNPATFVVHGSQTGKHTGSITLSGDTSFTFDPTIEFMPGEVVTVSLTKDILSAQGESLVNGYHWRFLVNVEGGSGVFTLDSTYGGFSYPERLNAADFDNDAGIDLIVGANGNSVTVLKNNRQGKFLTRQQLGTGNNPANSFVADFDNDGYLDIAVCNSYSNTFSVLRNDGSGNFTTIYTSDSLGVLPFEIIGADFDGDGDVDIAITINNSYAFSISLNNGDGTFAAPVIFDEGGPAVRPHGIITSDVDNDGDLDLLVAVTPPYTEAGAYVAIYKNNGRGDFTKFNTISFNGAYSFAVADFDGDGDEDVAVANGINGFSILFNNGDGTYQAPVAYAPGPRCHLFRTADFNADGRPDLVVGTADTDSFFVYLNNGDGTFGSRRSFFVGYNDANNPAVADFDGNGSVDIAISSNHATDKLSIFKNTILRGSISGMKYNDVNGNGSSRLLKNQDY